MKKKLVILVSSIVAMFFLFGFGAKQADALTLRGQSHNADVGWGPHINATGSNPKIQIGYYGKRLEAFALNIDGGYTISYNTSIQSLGWEPVRKNGAIAGTVGKALKIDAIKIWTPNSNYEVRYKVHYLGEPTDYWGGTFTDSQQAGFPGMSRAIDALEVQFYKK